MNSRIISIVNQKGGVGKTTTSVNLSTAFAAVGYNTLIIDLDPQGNSSTGFGLEYSDRENSIYEVLIGQSNISKASIETEVPKLSLVPSTVDLSAADIDLSKMRKREYILKEKISESNVDYDYIIIDCPPSLGLLTINALVASSSVIIPSQCEFYALEGLSHLLRTISLVKKNLNTALYIDGIVLTMYDGRNKLSKQVENDVRGHLKSMVYKTIIPRNVRLSEAPSHGRPAVMYDVHCAGSRAYLHLAREILALHKENDSKKNA